MTSAIEARPTTYNGIRMRSRLEADYAAYLDRTGRTWDYEPECFANADGQWLPDFRVKFSNTETFIELKPAGRVKDDCLGVNPGVGVVDKLLAQMTIAWASKPNAELILIYWQYGGPAAMQIYSTLGEPWLAQGGPLPLLWSGMGQYERCTIRKMPAQSQRS